MNTTTKKDDGFAGFDEEKSLDRPSNKAWGNFAKFEKEGDTQRGILVDVFFKPEQGQFPEQRGFTLQTQSGELVNCAVKNNPDFAIRATDDIKLGDLMTITLSELKPSKTKGYNPTKIYAYSSASPKDGSNAEEPTVKELVKKEMAAAGLEREEEEVTNEVAATTPQNGEDAEF